MIQKLSGKDEVVNEALKFLRRHFYDLRFSEAMEEYLLKTDFDKLRGIGEEEREIFKKLKEYLVGYRQALKYMGGEKAFKMFKKLLELFSKFDGLTTYSENFWQSGYRHAFTEAFASIGDYIGDFIEFRRGEVKFNGENLVEMSGRRLSVVAYREYREEFRELLGKALDFLEKIGLMKWAGGGE